MDTSDHNATTEMTTSTSVSSTGQPGRQGNPGQDTGAVPPAASSLNSTGIRVASEIELGNRASLTSEPSLAELNRVTSSSYFSDDEGSGTDVSLGRHKKQKRSGLIESKYKGRLAVSSSSSESLTALKTSSRTGGSPSMGGNSSSKSPRRKAKKKEGAREEKSKEFGTPANFSEASS